MEMNQGIEKSRLQFCTLYGGWIFDDLSVTSEGVPAPSELDILSYKGTEMTVRWNAVEGAEGYVYNLFYPNNMSGGDLYLKKEEKTTDNTLTVTGLDPDIRYQLNVATVVGEKQSAYSQTFDITPILATPEPIRPTDYDGSAFTASWQPVENADRYVLNVYSYIDGGTRDEQVVPFIENREVTATSFQVTGIDRNTIYYFTVQAKNDNGDISDVSAATQILPLLDAPVAKPATGVKANSFVANWTPVTYANTYQVNVYREHTATADEVYDWPMPGAMSSRQMPRSTLLRAFRAHSSSEPSPEHLTGIFRWPPLLTEVSA